MASIKLRSRVDGDGVVHPRVPALLANQELELVVVYKPVAPVGEERTATELGYPTDFFERTFGAWQGEFLTRGEPDQPDKRDWDAP